MRKMTKPLALLTIAAALAACADASANASQDELKRDLELASATTMKLATPQVDSSLLSAMETKPIASPAPAPVVKRGAGPRAVASDAPTVEATAEEDVAAAEEVEAETETIAPAPAPESTEPVAVAPRPQPPIIQTGGAGDYGVGTGGMGGGDGRVVIRGGGVDGDNCRPRGRNGGPIVYRGPIYIPHTTVTPRGTRVAGRTIVQR